jgi:fucose permease
MQSLNSSGFRRTKTTWQAYLSIAYYSYLLNCLGPLAPFLRDELNLSYTIASLHLSAYAGGTVLSGLLLAKPAIRRFGAYRVMWGGGVGLALGALLVMAGRSAEVTIPGALLMGMFGVVIVAIFQGALAEQHGDHRAIALTESTVTASVLAGLSPIAIGFFARTFLTWRAALGLGIVFLVVLWLVFHRNPVPNMQNAEATVEATGSAAMAKRMPLPFLFWLYWVAALLAVSIEFCIILWGADYLERVAGLLRADAALGMGLFMGAMLGGRIINSRLVWNNPAVRLVKFSLGLAAVGFLIFWLVPMLLPGAAKVSALTGLMFSGLGISGLYPLLASQALGACPGQTVEGSAAFTLASGSAILTLPLLLGRLADWTGIRAAYGLVVVLIVLTFAVNAAAQRKQEHDRLAAATVPN